MAADVPISRRLTSSSRKVALEAQREALASELGRPGPLTTLSMMASASKELRAISAELAGLVKPKAGKLDELKSRREARHSDAVDPAPAARRSQPRRRSGGNRTS